MTKAVICDLIGHSIDATWSDEAGMDQGTIIEGKYELVRPIGMGGMGVVWEVRHIRSGQRLALKTIHKQYRNNKGAIHRFTREAKAAMDAHRSPHVIDIIEVSSLDDGRPYMILELLEGENLLEVLKREIVLAPDRSAGLIVQACEAVAEVHGQGIIHRDLKPGNLFVTKSSKGQEWIKLLDFGIAKFREKPDDTSQSLTEAGSALGTIRYMAPEQIADAKSVDHRSDVYSLGAILYRMLTGNAARDGKNIGQLIQNMTNHFPPSPCEIQPDLDPALSQVVMRCIDIDPNNRFTSVMDFAAALEPFCQSTIGDDDTLPNANALATTIPDYTPNPLGLHPLTASPTYLTDSLEETLENETTQRSHLKRPVHKKKKPFIQTLNLFKVPGTSTFEIKEPTPQKSRHVPITTKTIVGSSTTSTQSSDESTIIITRSPRRIPWYLRNSTLLVFLFLLSLISAALTIILFR
jgi:serine/threonine-protein kinase